MAQEIQSSKKVRFDDDCSSVLRVLAAFAPLLILLCHSFLAIAQEPHNLPNQKLTPGDAVDATRQEVCSPTYSSPAEQIPIDLKRKVFDRYGINPNVVGYDVDHLIPVSLGGTNSLKNLWPQPLAGEWNHQRKNKLETRLYKLVCKGDISIETARKEISMDWVECYKKYVKK